jgi:hypothetical protein
MSDGEPILFPSASFSLSLSLSLFLSSSLSFIPPPTLSESQLDQSGEEGHLKHDEGADESEDDEDEEELDEVIGYHFVSCTTLFVAYIYVNSGCPFLPPYGALSE